MEITDSQDIFAQLARTDGSSGVKIVIENHDAWTHSQTVQDALTAAVRVHLLRPLDAQRAARIAQQRDALAPLVTRLPLRRAAAC